MNEDKVRVPSLKKYHCKKNKGEHEWGKIILDKLSGINYEYQSGFGAGVMSSNRLLKDKKLLGVGIFLCVEVRCIHCKKKVVKFLRERIKK